MRDIRTFRILYMEDDEGLSRILQKDLQRKGYAVDVASNGEEGLKMLDAATYDMVVVDYHMPVLGGLEVIRELSLRGSLLPAIMVTGYGNEKVAVEAMKLGAADYIVKDTELGYLELLPIVIEQVISKQKLIREKEQMLAKIQESEERYRKLYELTTDGIFICHDWKMEFVNPSGLRLLAASSVLDLKEKTLFEVIHPDYWGIFRDRVAEADNEDGRVPWFESKIRSFEGNDVHVEIMAVAFSHFRGKQAIQVIMRDITERKLAEERLQFLAHYDPLTGIPNRTLFFDRLSHALAQAKRYGHSISLMFLDLDRFKEINDTLGHEAGDELLKVAAVRLLHCVRNSDTVARMGGDEFTVILSRVSGAEDTEIIAERILSCFGEPFNLKGQKCSVGVSIGICLYPQCGSDPEILLRMADNALYRAKEQGGNCFHFYG